MQKLIKRGIILGLGGLAFYADYNFALASSSADLLIYGGVTLYLSYILLYIAVKQPVNDYKLPTVMVCWLMYPCYLLSVTFSSKTLTTSSDKCDVLLSNLFTAFLTLIVGVYLKGLIEGSAENKKAFYLVIFTVTLIGMMILYYGDVGDVSWAAAFVSAILANTILEGVSILRKNK